MRNQITRRQFLKRACSVSFGLLAGYPTLVERSMVVTNVYRVGVPNLPPAFSGFRIAQLTDIHYGRLMPLSSVERIVERTNDLKVDLVACTGDYVTERNAIERVDEVWKVLSTLSAPCGVCAVLGNHDHWAGTDRSMQWMQEAGQDLRHKVRPITRGGQTLWIAGAGDFLEDHVQLDTLLHRIPDSDCRIVLAHNPDTADSDFTGRVDLMISGHTHGGQVDIPLIGPPVLPVRNRNYSSGLKTSPRGCNVFISRGIGWTMCPVRFNCLPEIAVLELFPGPKTMPA